ANLRALNSMPPFEEARNKDKPTQAPALRHDENGLSLRGFGEITALPKHKLDAFFLATREFPQHTRNREHAAIVTLEGNGQLQLATVQKSGQALRSSIAVIHKAENAGHRPVSGRHNVTCGIPDGVFTAAGRRL